MDPNSYITSVVRALERFSQPHGQPMYLANVGAWLIRENLHWRAFGYTRLTGLLAELERRGLAKVRDHGQGTQLVELLPQPALEPQVQVLGSEPNATQQTLLSRPFRPLRFSLWAAFATSGTEPKFLDRQTWFVVSGTPSAHQDAVVIESIPPDVQRGWAQDFIRTARIRPGESFEAVLRAPDWYRQFAHALSDNKAQLSAWKRFRSQMIIAHVRNWAERNDVPQDRLFYEPQPVHRDEVNTAGLQSNTTAPLAIDPRPQAAEKETRAAILEALAELPTEDLLRIPIPAHILIDKLRSVRTTC